MSADENRRDKRRAFRQVEKADLPEGPDRQLRDALYELYLRAGPTLDELAAGIAADEDLPGSPGRDTISRIISGRELPAARQDAVTVAVALAHLCGRDSAVIADRVSDLWVAAKMAPSPKPPARLGKPVGDCDPIALEVHRAINIPDQDSGAPVLPAYVRRGHDARLARIVAEARSGHSRVAVLVGGSSTGKTRACWEAIQGLPDQWRVWHPIDPSRPDAAAAALGQVAPYTVVWLNEAQYYLLPADTVVGERVAAGLRTLLDDPGRGPALVLATMWPDYWSKVHNRPTAGSPDPYAQARELLAGADIRVPDAFTAIDLRALRNAAAGDLRLAHTAEHSQDGQVTQHLAGVPELLTRYRNAPPAARAVIDVAIDARRLGHPPAIPHALLEHAAPGYLDDMQWRNTTTGDDGLARSWGQALDVALAWTDEPCHGVPGPLTRIRPRPGDPPTGGSHYRLADYLEQTGRTERACVFPPAAFWSTAATVVTEPGLLQDLGVQASLRGRYHRAAQMYRRAADRGDPFMLGAMARKQGLAGDVVGAEALAVQAADRGDTDALKVLAQMREESGDITGAGDLYRLAADRGDTGALWALARTRLQAAEIAEALYQLAADRGDAGAQQALERMRERTAETVGDQALYRQATDCLDAGALWALARMREQAADTAEILYQKVADRSDADALWALARMREQAGDTADAEALYGQAADRGFVGGLRALERMRERTGDTADAEALALARIREQAGDTADAEALYRQAADRGDTGALQALAGFWELAGDAAGADCVRRFGLADDGSVATSLDVDL